MRHFTRRNTVLCMYIETLYRLFFVDLTLMNRELHQFLQCKVFITIGFFLKFEWPPFCSRCCLILAISAKLEKFCQIRQDLGDFGDHMDFWKSLISTATFSCAPWTCTRKIENSSNPISVLLEMRYFVRHTKLRWHPFLFVGLHYPPNWKIEICFKKRFRDKLAINF